ncbi:hypothetical protein [Cellulomonas sp. P24]|uniref:hypothetical protein n=1 Tax=Cellulomonas sp. P24 TaxID=2885206 RepID=UPI00216B4DF0|nr:hypothetical protein [Cellulomonas sp. P24]MCR6492679.1 hypothetical protein [Cellulomonas sp. P24]
MTTSGPGTSARPPQLREQWRVESTESVWIRPADWYHPAVDALVEAVEQGAVPVAVAERLGEVRATDGVGINEAIDDLTCLYRSLGSAEPPLALVRALCAGWASAQASTVVLGTCIDPESGLPTREYLIVRLGELYGAAARAGTTPTSTHGLVLIDVSTAGVSPWTRMACAAAIGAALGDAYGDGRPVASLGAGLFAVVVERDENLGSHAALLRDRIHHQAALFDIEALMRNPARIWIEGLPSTHEAATMLLMHARG